MKDPYASRFEMREGDYIILARGAPIQKWDESQHPRDKIGQFARSGTARQPGEAAPTSTMKIEMVTTLAHAEAKRMGVDPSRIHVIDEPPQQFMVGNQQFNEGGHYDPVSKTIIINVRTIDDDIDAPAIKGLITHELTHLVHHELHEAGGIEFEQYQALAFTENSRGQTIFTPWFYERFDFAPGFGRRVKPAYQAELATQFPATALLSRLSGGQAYMFELTPSVEMILENGHSEYAKTYWMPEAVKDQHHYHEAISETIAEVTRFLHHPESWDEPHKPDPNSPWVTFTRAMHTWYRQKHGIQA